MWYHGAKESGFEMQSIEIQINITHLQAPNSLFKRMDFSISIQEQCILHRKIE
jgi:hypothetical protein